MSGQVNDRELVKVIDKAVDILFLFSQETQELMLSEISSKLGMHKSTVYRILRTLSYRGLIQQKGTRRGLSPSKFDKAGL